MRLLARWITHLLTRPVAAYIPFAPMDSEATRVCLRPGDVLPERLEVRGGEQFRIRNHTLFTPRDFDLSPFFQVVKPTLARGFDYKGVAWEGLDLP